MMGLNIPWYDLPLLVFYILLGNILDSIGQYTGQDLDLSESAAELITLVYRILLVGFLVAIVSMFFVYMYRLSEKISSLDPENKRK